MTKLVQSLPIFSVLLGVSIFLVGCGDPQKSAMKELKKNKYAYTVEDFLVAAGAGDLDNMALFLESGMEIDAADAEGNTALIEAASNGRLAVVERALGLGADPLQRNQYGRDALISASSKGFEEVSRLLVARGADQHAKDTEGWNALSIAAYNGHDGVVSLLSSQANQEMLDNALLLAAFNGNGDVIQNLLSQGAYINARSPENQTPLMIASSAGHQDAVVVFLQNQANPYSTNDEGQTAAVIAEAKGFGEIRDLILHPGNAGATEEGIEIAEEMQEAQDAIVEGSVEEELSAPVAEEVASTEVEDATETTSTEVASAENPPNSSAPAEAATENRGNGELVQNLSTRTRTQPQAQPQPTAPVAVGSIPVPGTSSAPIAVTSRPAYQYPAPEKSVEVAAVPSPKKLRETAKERPMAALNGSIIKSRDPKTAAVESFVLASYRERPIPIAVNQVEGDSAQIRMLNASSEEPVQVAEGAAIPGTNYEVEKVTHKMVSSKEGKGKLVDVSQVKVRDIRTGSSHLLVKDVSGSTSDSYAILAAPGSDYRYVVKTGDTFRTEQPGLGVRDYQVLDIRPTGVVMKDLTSGQVMTVARDGVVAP